MYPPSVGGNDSGVPTSTPPHRIPPDTTTTIAKRTNGKHQTINEQQRDKDEDDDDEELNEDDLSIENYMRRHPCVLDRGSDFLERHRWIYPTLVVCFTSLTILCGTYVACFELQFTNIQLSIVYTMILIDYFLFYRTLRTPPGQPPSCPDESRVIQLLHTWPSKPHHYGLHASEWSRTWSYCQVCQNWRPARSHHCSTCQRCVMMMDHHCRWIGQCVGANNFKIFATYVTFTCLLALYGLSLAYSYAFIDSSSSSSPISTPTSTPTPRLNLPLLFLLFFLTFTGSCASGWLVLRCLWIVCNNETGIESLKKYEYQRMKRKEKEEAEGSSTSSSSSSSSLLLTKENMLLDSGKFNGSHPSSSSSSSSRTVLLESGGLSPTPVTSSRYFAPFQCKCHADSFKLYYCQSFNYPTIESRTTPIPPLPHYYDYHTSNDGEGCCDVQYNCFLFFEDMKRMIKLHTWILEGSKPIQGMRRHMRLPLGKNESKEVSIEEDGATNELLLQVQPVQPILF